MIPSVLTSCDCDLWTVGVVVLLKFFVYVISAVCTGFFAAVVMLADSLGSCPCMWQCDCT